MLDGPAVPQTDSNELIQSAASMLKSSRMPLVCGLADQSLETQQAAVHLAKNCNAVIDWTKGDSAFALQHAFQEIGHVSCTFQEIRDRADLILYWSSAIQKTHPSFVERFVSDKPTIAIEFSREEQWDTLRYLREANKANAGDALTDAKLIALKQRIDQAEYPVILIDDHLPQNLGEAGMQSLFRFVVSQNDTNHCRLVHLSEQENTAGIRSVLTALAGGPYGIAFRKGRPFFRGREFTVEPLISRQIADLVVLVGSVDQLPESVRGSQTPMIWISDRPAESLNANVTIRISRWGLDCDGTGVRDDGVPVFRQAIADSDLPDGVQILNAIANLLQPLKA